MEDTREDIMQQHPRQDSHEIAVGHDWDVKERREYERYSVENYLRVIDVETGKHLGDVVDISLGGIRLLSHAALQKGQSFRMRFEIAMGEEYRAEVLFVGNVVWSRNDIDPGFYTSGIKYIQISAAARANLRELINLLKASLDEPLA